MLSGSLHWKCYKVESYQLSCLQCPLSRLQRAKIPNISCLRRSFTMCNCLPSTLPHSLIKSHNHLNPITIFSPQKINTRISPSNTFPLHKSISKNFIIKVSNKSENYYNLHKELGFKKLKITSKNQEIDDHMEGNGFDFLELNEKKEIRDSELGFKEFEITTKNQETQARDDDHMSNGFDFLELNEEKESKDLEFEELVQVGSSGEGDDLMGFREEEEIGEIVERKEVKKRRMIVRRSNIIAKQVISIQSALNLGFVSQIWVDTCSWVVLVVEVRPSMLSGEMERFLLEDVRQVGDVVLVEDESVLEEDIKMLGLDTLVGYNVVTPSRRSIGKVRGFTFNINSGAVELLELDSFGISLIPSSLVSTYGLLVEDVIDVESDTVVVHEDAASSLQRLTKGIWDTPTMGTFKDELEEYPEFERRPQVQPESRRNKRKFTSREVSENDDLPLPMDYL